MLQVAVHARRHQPALGRRQLEGERIPERAERDQAERDADAEEQSERHGGVDGPGDAAGVEARRRRDPGGGERVGEGEADSVQGEDGDGGEDDAVEVAVGDEVPEAGEGGGSGRGSGGGAGRGGVGRGEADDAPGSAGENGGGEGCLGEGGR